MAFVYDWKEISLVYFQYIYYLYSYFKGKKVNNISFHMNLTDCIAMQTGFGWSNGVVLAFLEEFGWPEDRKIEC